MHPENAHHKIEAGQRSLCPGPAVLSDEFKPHPAPFSAKERKRNRRNCSYSIRWTNAHPISVFGDSQAGKLENVWPENDDEVRFKVLPGFSSAAIMHQF